jgi:hypothetical protein
MVLRGNYTIRQIPYHLLFRGSSIFENMICSKTRVRRRSGRRPQSRLEHGTIRILIGYDDASVIEYAVERFDVTL